MLIFKTVMNVIVFNLVVLIFITLNLFNFISEMLNLSHYYRIIWIMPRKAYSHSLYDYVCVYTQ